MKSRSTVETDREKVEQMLEKCQYFSRWDNHEAVIAHIQESARAVAEDAGIDPDEFEALRGDVDADRVEPGSIEDLKRQYSLEDDLADRDARQREISRLESVISGAEYRLPKHWRRSKARRDALLAIDEAAAKTYAAPLASWDAIERLGVVDHSADGFTLGGKA